MIAVTRVREVRSVAQPEDHPGREEARAHPPAIFSSTIESIPHPKIAGTARSRWRSREDDQASRTCHARRSISAAPSWRRRSSAARSNLSPTRRSPTHHTFELCSIEADATSRTCRELRRAPPRSWPSPPSASSSSMFNVPYPGHAAMGRSAYVLRGCRLSLRRALAQVSALENVLLAAEKMLPRAFPQLQNGFPPVQDDFPLLRNVFLRKNCARPRFFLRSPAREVDCPASNLRSPDPERYSGALASWR